ncbi:MAG: DUF1460 domain-containing protein [Prevotella sp.]|nr:DUF1460 domain-containing protein [Prevotella sp.]
MPHIGHAQNITIYSKPDSLIYERYIARFEKQKKETLGELLINSAKFFIGKPYVASTLEGSDNETLTINLRELDCTTFIENCVVLSLVIKSGDHSFDNYRETLRNTRYRNGVVDGYASRLHYTSDWIYENAKRGILKNISKEIGGKTVRHPLSFMSEYSLSYKHLKNNPSEIKKIKDIEAIINGRNNYEIIPVSSITANEKNIKDGDIIAFATSISGLDYSHVGMAYRQNGELHFIHASSSQKQVVIEKKTLSDYCKSSKNCTGISILRINK